MPIRDGLEQGWFSVFEVEPGIHRIVEPLHTECVNSYLVVGTDRAILIDTGMGVGDLSTVVAGITSLPVLVVNSHAHWDHIGANWRFSEIAIHRAEANDILSGVGNQRMRQAFNEDSLLGELPVGTSVETLTIPGSTATTILVGGEILDLGGRSLEVIHTPGHSPGGVVLLDRAKGVLFSTDLAYPEPLYSQYDDANVDEYAGSMRLLKELSPSLRVVYPSHEQKVLAPSDLVKMSEAFDMIQSGRAADSVDGAEARHQFDGFSILVPA